MLPVVQLCNNSHVKFENIQMKHINKNSYKLLTIIHYDQNSKWPIQAIFGVMEMLQKFINKI